MAKPFGSQILSPYGVDYDGSEALNVALQNLAAAPVSPVLGQIWFDTVEDAPAVELSTGDAYLADRDWVTTFVEDALNARSWKQSVRAATTTAGTLVSSFEDGDTVDGVVLAAGDRILVKNQAAPAENGIYVVAASGAPARAADADTASELHGAAVFVSEGTTNGNTQWQMTTDLPITVNTTGLVWAQVGGGASYTGTSNRITITGNQIDIAGTYVGQTSITTLGTIATGVWNGTDIAVADGGTGASDAATARTNLGVPGVYKGTFTGNGSATTFTITHNLGSQVVAVTVLDPDADYNEWVLETDRPTTNTCRVKWATPPDNGKVYHVIVTG